MNGCDEAILNIDAQPTFLKITCEKLEPFNPAVRTELVKGLIKGLFVYSGRIKISQVKIVRTKHWTFAVVPRGGSVARVEDFMHSYDRRAGGRP